MFYDNPHVVSYHLNAVDFSAGATISLPTMNGRRGRVVGASVHAESEAFTGDLGQLTVGDGSDVDAYFDSGARPGYGGPARRGRHSRAGHPRGRGRLRGHGLGRYGGHRQRDAARCVVVTG